MASGKRAGVGMVGYAFMGHAHSEAWRNVASAFQGELRPELVAICGRDPEAVKAAAHRFGWEGWETDWRRLIERDDIDIIDVSTPGSSHAEISVAALDAGKHVLCEKPLANSIAEAELMVAAADRAFERQGTVSMVGFNYRRLPAMALAQHMIGGGALGQIRHVRATYLQDWLVDPNFPLSWRLRKEEAGSGSLGDLASHIVDLVQFITGETVTKVSAVTETFVPERPLASDSGSGGSERGSVTVDDAALFLARMSGGSVASFESTRFATGRKNGLRLELNGERASIAFDLERMNELEFYDATLGSSSGWRRILVTEPSHPYLSAWWPPGHILGWDHTFVHEVSDFLDAISAGTQPRPSFADGLQVQRVLAAVEASAASGSWTQVG